MKTTIRLSIALILVAGLITSCKTQQKVAEVPAGAYKKAITQDSNQNVDPNQANTKNAEYNQYPSQSAPVQTQPQYTTGQYQSRTSPAQQQPAADNQSQSRDGQWGANGNSEVSEGGTYSKAVTDRVKTRNENFTLVDGESAAFKSKFHVVVGSFSKQDNARGLQQTLKNEGNNAIVVINEKGMYRVLINSYNDYDRAHNRIRQIADRFPDAWVLVQK